jgi:hypothetical protein
VRDCLEDGRLLARRISSADPLHCRTAAWGQRGAMMQCGYFFPSAGGFYGAVEGINGDVRTRPTYQLESGGVRVAAVPIPK